MRPALDLEEHLGGIPVEGGADIFDAIHGTAVDGTQPVSGPDPGLCGRITRFDLNDLDECRPGLPPGRQGQASQRPVQVGALDAQGRSRRADGHGLAAAEQFDLHFVPGAQQAQHIAHVLDVTDLFSVNAHQDVPRDDAGLVGRRLVHHFGDDDALGLFEAEGFRQFRRHGLGLYPELTTLHLAELG